MLADIYAILRDTALRRETITWAQLAERYAERTGNQHGPGTFVLPLGLLTNRLKALDLPAISRLVTDEPAVGLSRIYETPWPESLD